MPAQTQQVTNPLAQFDDLLTEAEVCKRYSRLLGLRELRDARQQGLIAFMNGKKSQPLYWPAWIADYLQQKVTPCQRQQSGFGNTEITGSAALPGPSTCTPAGGTSESDERVAEVLTQKFSRKLKAV